MKKKRLVMISFVLISVLAMGIGFAAMADTLTISGPVNFVKADEVLGQKADAIKFSDAKSLTTDEDGGAVTVVANVSQTNENLANMTVTINGVTGQTEEYEGEALFTVTYETTNTTLDPVYLFPVATISNDPTGFTINVEITDENGEVLGDADANKLARGEEMYVKVTVTYDPTEVDVEKTVVENITVQLVYEDVNEDPHP